jgi:hypothetical protein
MYRHFAVFGHFFLPQKKGNLECIPFHNEWFKGVKIGGVIGGFFCVKKPLFECFEDNPMVE